MSATAASATGFPMQKSLGTFNGPTNFNRGSALFGLYFNRGTASRHCPEGLPRGTWVSFDVVDGLRGVVGRSQSCDDARGGGGANGADAAASDVEVLLM